MDSEKTRRDFLKSLGSVGAPAVLFPITSSSSLFEGKYEPDYDLTDILDNPMNITSEGYIDLDGDGEISEYDARLRRGIPQDLGAALKDAYNLPEPEVYDRIASGEELSNDDEGVLDVKLTYGDIPSDIPEYVGDEFLEPWTNFVAGDSNVDVHDEEIDLNKSESSADKIFSDAAELAQEYEGYDIVLHLSSHTGEREDQNDLLGRGHVSSGDTPEGFTCTSTVYVGNEGSVTENENVVGKQEALEQIEENQETIPLIIDRDDYSEYQPFMTMGHELSHNLGFGHEDIEVQPVPNKEEGKAALAGAIGGNYSYDAYTFVRYSEEPDNSNLKASYNEMEEIDGEISKLLHSTTPVGNSLDQELFYNRN
ncbi:MAG: hypothetical protein BRC29_00580 [Nanohaloarchaea archaeon SW_7_43_1]|nr:MAG: hypothetical protein BRC29_00580 [Nanohaloarchaea archaeon SW_7_43_1]